MPKSLKLLLVESVDNLGIVGDVVNVRLGYARNYLLPRALATTPSDDLIKSLAGKRADAERHLAELRTHREQMIGKLQNVDVTLTRSCNDLGVLYASVTQQDLAKALAEQGYNVKPREVRLTETIKRVGNYEIHVKLDADLDATIKLHVKPDRELESREKPEGKPEGDAAAKKEGKEGEAPVAAEGKPDAKKEGGDDRPRKRREDREDRQFRRRDAFMDNIPKEEKTGWAAKSDPSAPAGAPAAAKDAKKDKGDKPAKAEKSAKGDKGGKKKGKE